VIAPDSFKESLGAFDVAQALAAGVLLACPDAQIDLCPLADGGEGTVDALVAATGGRVLFADVFDALGQTGRAKFGILGSPQEAGSLLPGMVGLTGAMTETESETAPGGTAVIEMAAAAGLSRVPIDKRNPARTTTFGVGQLITAALDAGADEILLGLGDSATCDGGAGALQAIGVEFYDADDEPCVCGLAGMGLVTISRVDTKNLDSRLANVKLTLLCDVDNPLVGPTGAARVFGPQKGATPETVEQLDAGLTHWADILREQADVEVATLPGAGAAGGLASGLVALAGATIEPGGKRIAEAAGLANRLRGASLCITGEGRLDAQSLAGKTAVRVADLSGREGVSTICIAGELGDVSEGESHPVTERFREVHTLVAANISRSRALADPGPLLTERARQAVQAFLLEG